MLALVLMSYAVAAAPCEPGEIVVFHCQTTKPTTLAACAGPPSPDPGYLQVRVPFTPELTFPPQRAGFTMFRAARTPTGTTLHFAQGEFRYELWQRGKTGGLTIFDGDKALSTLDCNGAPVTNWESVEAFLNGAVPDTSKPVKGARPDPLAGKTRRELCEDDALLLLKYEFDDLRFKDGFKRECCVAGALGSDNDRCGYDWPAGDMLPCSDIDLLRNKLFALYGRRFHDVKFQRAFEPEPWYRLRDDFELAWVPAVAQKNAERLRDLVKKGGCVADDPPPKTAAAAKACEKAAIRWSLDLQNATKGHVDGMQQSEIAEAVTDQCLKGWPEAVVSCLASGKGNRCLAPLTDAQRATVKAAIKAISEDVRVD